MTTSSKAPPAAPRASRADALASLAAGLVAFVLYAALCAPNSGPGDSSEFALVLATNGVAHPTGYPLYTLFGHGFAALVHALGVGWPLAANLWSAVGAAVAVGFLHALALRLTLDVPGAGGAARNAAALVPVALFAFQPTLLPEATGAEVNSWSVAWACVAGWLFVRLHETIERGGKPDRRRDQRGAVVWGLVCGAGLAHHLTSVLVAAPLTVALGLALARRRRLAFALFGAAIVAACVPLASYGIVAWRAYHPATVQWPDLAPSLASVRDHVTGEQYRPFLGRFAPAEDQKPLLLHFTLPFLVLGLAALLAGAARARERGPRAIRLGLAAAAALVTGFTLRYGVPDPAPYFLPAMALGAAGAAPELLALAGPRRRGAVLRLAPVALVALVLIGSWIGGGRTARGESMAGERILRAMWSAVPADSAIVFWPDDRFYHLREYQVFAGEKPAVLVLCPELLLADATRAQLVRRYGVDPLAGYPFPTTVPGDPAGDRLRTYHLRELLHRLNDRVRVPVIVFDPSVPIVQELKKRNS